MRILTIVALLVLAFTSASKAANDGPVLSDFGGPQYTNCYYYSARECLIAAGIRGGACERNRGATPETPKKDKRKARSR
jgi:hypothetical protein